MVAPRESRRVRYTELDLVPHLRALDGDVDLIEINKEMQDARIERIEKDGASTRLMVIVLTLVSGGDLILRAATTFFKF